MNLGWIEEVLGLQPSSRAGVAGAAGAAGAVPGPTFCLLRLVTSWGCSGGAPRRGREGGAIATSEGRVGAVTEDAPSAVGSDELGLSAEERAQVRPKTPCRKLLLQQARHRAEECDVRTSVEGF